MEKKTILFWQWILQRWKTGVLFLGISGIYFLMCWLYGLELVGAFYAFMLTLVLLAAVFYWDYQRFKRRHEQLTGLLVQEYLAQKQFPETKDLLEKDYQELLLHLSTCISNMESEREKEQTRDESVLYYVGASDQNADFRAASVASAVGGFGEERDGDGTFPYRAICADGAVLSENERYRTAIFRSRRKIWMG